MPIVIHENIGWQGVFLYLLGSTVLTPIFPILIYKFLGGK